LAHDQHERVAILVGRQPLFLDAVEQLLAYVDVQTLAKVLTVPEAEVLAVEHGVDLLLIDVEGNDAAERPLLSMQSALKQVPGLRALVISSSAEPSAMGAAFAAGASGYVLKRTPSDDLASAVRQLFDRSIFHAPAAHAERPLAGRAVEGPRPKLTRREHEILSLVVEGRRNSEIAKLLWVTVPTVKFHLANLYRKLGVSNRTQASYRAHGYEIIEDGGAHARGEGLFGIPRG
jgi:DNA-binding NarL/FixJ family response regulator